MKDEPSSGRNVTERRGAKRTAVMLTAAIERDGTSTSVRLTNISDNGSAICGGALPPRDARVTFKRNDVELHGRVAWRRDGQCGLHFRDSLTLARVLNPIAAPRVPSRASWRRSPLQSGPLTRIERDSIYRCANLLGIRTPMDSGGK